MPRGKLKKYGAREKPDFWPLESKKNKLEKDSKGKWDPWDVFLVFWSTYSIKKLKSSFMFQPLTVAHDHHVFWSTNLNLWLGVDLVKGYQPWNTIQCYKWREKSFNPIHSIMVGLKLNSEKKLKFSKKDPRSWKLNFWTENFWVEIFEASWNQISVWF